MVFVVFSTSSCAYFVDFEYDFCIMSGGVVG